MLGFQSSDTGGALNRRDSYDTTLSYYPVQARSQNDSKKKTDAQNEPTL